jgi:putative copper resistance protein D
MSPALATVVGPGLAGVLEHWHADPGPLAVAAIAAVAYLRGARRGTGARRLAWPRRRTAAFLVGLAALLAALVSGLDDEAAGALSAHMVQHLVITFVAAPLLVAGAPVRLALGTAPPGRVRDLGRILASWPVRMLGRPPVAWAPLPAVMLVSHFTGIYDMALRHPAVHELEHLVYLAAALVFWWPVVGADPVPHAPGGIGRAIHVLLAMPVMTVIGVALVDSDRVWYPAYLAPAHSLHTSALADQHRGGMIMWTIGCLLLAGLLVAVTWQRLVEEERRARARDALTPIAPAEHLAQAKLVGPGS